MFNLASSLLYQQLFNQQNNGEQVYEGSSAQKTPTYNLGVKGIPDDVLWALSAVNLDQYDLPEWKITLNKGGVNLTMAWSQPSDDGNGNNTANDSEKPSVIKKLGNGISLGLPVGKLVNGPGDHHSPQPTLPYMNRIPQMQSILTIRPDQFRQTATPLSALSSQPERNSVIHERLSHLNTEDHRVKANSIESPPEKSDEELIEPGSPDKPFIPPPVNGHSEVARPKDSDMEVDSHEKTGCCETETKCCGGHEHNRGEIKVEHSPTEGSRDMGRYISTETSEELLDAQSNDLQIDESEDVDVTDDVGSHKLLKSEYDRMMENGTGNGGEAANAAPWNNLPTRKSPIEQLLEQRAMQGGLNGLNGLNGQPTSSPFQSALGITPSTLSQIYANPVFHQNLRTASVLQSRGITPQTLPLLLPQNQPMLNSTSKMPNLFLATSQQATEGLKPAQRSAMISPVGRSPVCHINSGNMINGNRNGESNGKTGKDKGPFSCSLCGRTFSLRGNLLRHERIHRGDKPFRCRFCNKAFIQRTDVLAHERVHTGEKPFACQFCGKRFPRRSTMKEHEKSFCRARVAFEENRKKNMLEHADGNSPDESASPDSKDQPTISGSILALPSSDVQKSSSSNSSSNGNSSEGGSSSSKTPSPEHPSQIPEKTGIDASDFSVKAVIAQ